MWSSETEKATEWDLFLPCRATCKVRIPRDSGEKKPTETGWFFNDWWWNTEPNPRPPRSSPESVRKPTVLVLDHSADLAGIRQIGMTANLA